MTDSKRDADMQIGGGMPPGNNLTSREAALSQGIDPGEHHGRDNWGGAHQRHLPDDERRLMPPEPVAIDPELFGAENNEWPTPEQLTARRNAGALAAQEARELGIVDSRRERLFLAADTGAWPLMSVTEARRLAAPEPMPPMPSIAQEAVRASYRSAAREGLFWICFVVGSATAGSVLAIAGRALGYW